MEFEKSEQAKARQQAEGNRHLEDVIVIYRTILSPDGTGELFTLFLLPERKIVLTDHPGTQRVERKIKYYAIESVDVLMKLTGGGPEAW
ncbi:hypothetical protein QFC22_003480 [Naganishia vaughanmartiniae]|uniref:Uncharacterized protein n=1 Tax=Naganishia vaughanmartiniae TaxID=1424756 RepID=A0ACC2X6T4_9TREE|nr:hypothetical protein QFC22_003480 [Naganishia vaughanmartiniae]